MPGQPTYFSLQGKAYIATRQGNGKPGAMTWLFNVPELSIALNSETEEHIESYSGKRLQDDRFIKQQTAEVSVTLQDFNRNNLALALYGTKVAINAGTVSNEIMPNPVAVNDYVRLERENVSSVVVTDSAGTPATLVQGTHYQVVSAFGGMIEFLNITGFTQPFKAAYSYAVSNAVVLFGTNPEERWLVFDGINTRTGAAVKLDLYRVLFDPVSDFGLVHDEYGSLELKGSVLYDATRALDPVLGGFGRMVMPGA